VLPASFLAGLSIEARSEALAARFSNPDYAMIVAESSSGAFLGFADWGPGRDELSGCRELYSIYVDPRHHRVGVGRELFRAALSAIVSEGHDRLRLSVLAANPHIEFYHRLGGESIGTATCSLAGAEWELYHFEWSGARLHGNAAS
jgi:ribosomal protein S18 acetylase RimI-like enzyme